MERNELDFILQEGEGLKIEFKEKLANVDKHIVAFSNASGGRIFVGVDDKGKVRGIDITNKLKSEIQSIARNCDLPIEIELKQFENILIIETSEGPNKLYKCKDGFYIRKGATSQKMTRDEIMDFSVSEGKIKFDTQSNDKFSIEEDFDKEKFENYLARANLSKLIPTERILRELGVINGGFNNAGVLFFSKNPQQFVPHSVFTCASFRDKDGSEVIDRKELFGNLVEIVEEVMKFVEFYTRVAYRFTGKPKRENIYEYPLRAIREAVINSVIHKDYFETGHNNILKIFPERIHIENVWRKPRHFKLGETVFRRNPIIANLFSRINFGEKLGSGFARMKEYCRVEKAPSPKIKFTETHFYIEFRQNPEYLRMATPQVTPQVELTGLEKKIIAQIKENPKISRTELAKKLSISPDTVKEYLDKLKSKGTIKRIGKTSAGYWEVIK